MKSVSVSITCKFESDEDPEIVFDEATAALFEVAAGDSLLADPDVSAILAQSIMTLSISAMDTSFLQAASRATSAIRTALHISGGSTHGWIDAIDTPMNKFICEVVEHNQVEISELV